LRIPKPVIIQGDFFPTIGLLEMKGSNFSFAHSSAEQALMEILAELSQTMSYTHALLLFEGKESLRSSLIQEFLECCLFYKVK